MKVPVPIWILLCSICFGCARSGHLYHRGPAEADRTAVSEEYAERGHPAATGEYPVTDHPVTTGESAFPVHPAPSGVPAGTDHPASSGEPAGTDPPTSNEELPLAGTSGRDPEPIRTGAECMESYLPLIRDRNLALVANHTSVMGDIHLVDTLLSRGIRVSGIMKVFVPEHGLRGDFEAGAEVASGKDPVTGIPVVSLYGEHKKPLPGDLTGVDMVLFDIQDVGVRFYTYISTLHYVMEACAENQVPLIVLDRPNPHIGYVDGPVLEPEFTSFVGMHPIPVVYGLTIGELAGMINGEGWLEGGLRCDLRVIPCENYDRGKPYSMPVPPSPNLNSDQAIRLYPSTCFFEGTVISEGRGTIMPFQVYGHPELEGEFSFTPVPIPGMSSDPKLEGQRCHGKDLRDFDPPGGWNRIFLHWLLDAYGQFPRGEEFFTPYFENLAGTRQLRTQIVDGWDESQIRNSWQDDLEQFRKQRDPYLIYR